MFFRQDVATTFTNNRDYVTGAIEVLKAFAPFSGASVTLPASHSLDPDTWHDFTSTSPQGPVSFLTCAVNLTTAVKAFADQGDLFGTGFVGDGIESITWSDAEGTRAVSDQKTAEFTVVSQFCQRLAQHPFVTLC